MQYSYAEIKAYFEKSGYKMHQSDENRNYLR